MKIKLTALLLAFVFWGVAQQTPDAALFTDGEAQVHIPKSPEAGALGKYGSIPLNGSTGQMNYGLPLFNITIDGNSWPISLNYNYGGLLLEGKPSLNGLGWSLLANAAVSREIRGLADEHQYGYHSDLIADGANTVRDLVYNYISGGKDAWNLATLRQFLDGKYDSEADKYTVNAGGMNFSFKIDRTVNTSGHFKGKAYKLSKNANDVEVIWSTTRNGSADGGNYYIEKFIVTDTKGVKYHFSKHEKTLPELNEELMINSITSWNIDKIAYLNGQNIVFNYAPDTYYDYSFSARGASTLAGIVEGNVDGAVHISPSYHWSTTKSRIQRQLLTSIIFPKGKIEFEYATIQENANAQGRKVYSAISLIDNSENTITEFEFDYEGNRDFLTEIRQNGEVYYAFEYHDESAIPDFLNDIQDEANAQDYYRFYNGANNLYALNIPNSIYTAAKDPSFSHTRLGALKKVIYPTKGSTTIFYEQNQLKATFVPNSDYYTDLPVGKSLHVEFDPNEGEYIDGRKEFSAEFTIDVPTVAEIEHELNGERDGNHIAMRITRDDGQYWYPVPSPSEPLEPTIPEPGIPDVYNYHNAADYLRTQIQQRAWGYVYPPMYPTLDYSFGPDDGVPGVVQENFNSGGKILMMPGTYVFSIYSDIPNTDVNASIDVQLFGTFNQPPPSVVNQDVGGIRVASLKDCPDNNPANCISRSFNYEDAEGFSTARLNTIPQRKTKHSWFYTFVDGSATYREAHSYLAQPFTVSNASIGTPVYYCSVEEKVDGPTGIGYVKRKYSFPYENHNINYPKRPTGKDLDKSLQIENLVFQENENTAKSFSKTRYKLTRGLLDPNGQDYDDTHPWSLKVYKKQHLNIDFRLFSYDVKPIAGSSQEGLVKDLYEVFPYREINNWDRPTRVSQEQDGMANVTNYNYNNQYQIKQETTTDSRGNIHKKEIKYPIDFLNVQTFYSMNNRGQRRQPVTIKSYYNDVLQSQTKIDYALNVNGYKPSKTYSAKGTGPLEPRLAMTYNNQGNVTQVDQLAPAINDPSNSRVLRSTAYLWGYNKEYLLAKVDNATIAEVNAVNFNQNTLNSLATTDAQKIAQLKLLQNGLPNSLITMYTHQPLIGVKSTLDTRGYSMHYEYDVQNRLKTIKDDTGNLVTDYIYKFKTQ